MEFVVLNCVAQEELREKIEKIAFYRGLSSWDLYRYVNDRQNCQVRAALWFADPSCLKNVPEDVIHFTTMQCPLILLTLSDDNEYKDSSEYKEFFKRYGCQAVITPSLTEFKQSMGHICMDENWKRRNLVFGRLEICRTNRKVFLDGRELDINGYAYDIFLMLLEHMGETVSRVYINQTLPRRVRLSERNVDTHIKMLRKNLGCSRVIRCVRSVGYRIPVEEFYIYCHSSD